MPAGSPEIANLFVELAAAEGRYLNQAKLHALVYIANGLSLSSSNRPLTLDQPVAFISGPQFMKLSDVLMAFECRGPGEWPPYSPEQLPAPEEWEREVVAVTLRDWGVFSSLELSIVTREENGAWALTYAGGRGVGREIPHELVQAQFVVLTADVVDEVA